MPEPLCFCGGPFQTNGYLLDYGSGEVLFDAPLGVTDWLESRDKKISHLVLTHLHHDHIMDAARVVETFGCPLWAHSDLSDELSLKSSLESATGMKWDLASFTTDRHLGEGEQLEFGERSLEVLHIPGHSPDSLCFYDAENRMLIGGDVLFQNSIGRTDFPNGDHDLLITGIREKLWPLPDDVVVYPGHGPETNIGFEKATNPFVR